MRQINGKPGLNVKAADKEIIKKLRAAGRLASEGVYHHSYPFCWRSDTPLIYRAVPSWFVKVESFREKLVKNNNKTYWVPEAVRANRFNNWLANANDWVKHARNPHHDMSNKNNDFQLSTVFQLVSN